MNVDKNVEKGMRFINLYNRLQSIVDSYKGHYGDADNYLEFESNLKDWKRNVYRSIFRNEYKIDIDNLSFNKKRFLHLLD